MDRNAGLGLPVMVGTASLSCANTIARSLLVCHPTSRATRDRTVLWNDEGVAEECGCRRDEELWVPKRRVEMRKIGFRAKRKFNLRGKE